MAAATVVVIVLGQNGYIKTKAGNTAHACAHPTIKRTDIYYIEKCTNMDYSQVFHVSSEWIKQNSPSELNGAFFVIHGRTKFWSACDIRTMILLWVVLCMCMRCNDAHSTHTYLPTLCDAHFSFSLLSKTFSIWNLNIINIDVYTQHAFPYPGRIWPPFIVVVTNAQVTLQFVFLLCLLNSNNTSAPQANIMNNVHSYSGFRYIWIIFMMLNSNILFELIANIFSLILFVAKNTSDAVNRNICAGICRIRGRWSPNNSKGRYYSLVRTRSSKMMSFHRTLVSIELTKYEKISRDDQQPKISAKLSAIKNYYLLGA